MKSLRCLTPLFATWALAVAAFAADAAGTWKWNIAMPNGEIETTLKLAMKDGKLAGTYSNQFGESAIASASLNADTLAFTVERELGGNKFTLKFRGKLDGDAIKGEFEAPGFDGGEPRKVEWNAKRVKDAAPPAAKK